MSIHAKLRSLQAELKAPKGQRNSFGNYNYRSAEDILEALKPLAVKHKLTFQVWDEIVAVGDRVYVKSYVSCSDDDGVELRSTAYAREEESKKGMDGSQVTGAASSYARKYALNGMLLIDDTKDSDATNTHGKSEKPASSAPTKSQGSVGKPDEDIMSKAIDYIKSQKDKKAAYNAVMAKHGGSLTEAQKKGISKFVR